MERDVVKAILNAYRNRGAYAVKIHGEARQPITVDILACYRGVFLAVEVKDGLGKEATPMQKHVLDLVKRAKGTAIVAHSLEEALLELDIIDQRSRRSSRIRAILMRFASCGNPQDYPRRPAYPQRLDIPFEWFEDAYNEVGDGRG